MKKVIFVVALLVFLILLVLLEGRAAVADEVVVIIGGWGSDKNPEELGYLQKNIPGSIVITPSRCWPLKEATIDVLQQLKQKGVALEELVLVGHSWGGLIAREIDAENLGLVSKVITIATPNAGFWYAPRFVYEASDSVSKTPIYVIAGADDEKVSLKSAVTVGRKPADFVIFIGLSHVGLLSSELVAQKINFWILQ